MLDLLVHRKWKKEKYTIGRLFANGTYLFNTLEDTDRGLASWMTEAVIKTMKVAGMTAIPTGTYEVRLSVSPKFKEKPWAKKYDGLVPEIVGVIGYSGVRIHPGTTAKDTDGCPLVGKNTQPGKLTSSQACYFELMDNYIVPALERGEEITLTIK